MIARIGFYLNHEPVCEINKISIPIPDYPYEIKAVRFEAAQKLEFRARRAEESLCLAQ